MSERVHYANSLPLLQLSSNFNSNVRYLGSAVDQYPLVRHNSMCGTLLEEMKEIEGNRRSIQVSWI